VNKGENEMAKTRSLPDKFYDKDYEHNGIHRVHLWRIAGYALNNTATNVYLMMMNYATYYLMGWVGVGMMVASSLTMMMRIWDGVTDPFVGFMVDKTNSKFGKNRPFIVIGQIILCVTSYIAFHVTHKLPQGVRFPFYVVVLMVYYLGYTCQCVVTKSAQSCMTNDPKQRPMFASFDGVFNTLLFAILGIIIPRIADGYTDVGGYASTQFMHTLWLMTAIMSACFTVIAVISITPKDRPEFFGTGKPVKVGLKDYWDTLKNNRQNMSVTKQGKGYVARYTEVDASTMTTEIYPGKGPGCEYVGHIVYLEKVYECTGKTISEAKTGTFTTPKARRIRELTRYDGKKWIY